MNKIITLILFSLLLISCNNETKAKSDGSQNSSAKIKSDAVGAAIHLTKAEFLSKVMNYEKNPTEWVYEGELPCLVDFYADWCGPCKVASPVLEELAAEYAGKIIIYKVNTDAENELAGVFGISSIPSFLLVPAQGKPTMSSGIGRTPEETKEMFRKMIDEVLLGQGA